MHLVKAKAQNIFPVRITSVEVADLGPPAIHNLHTAR